MDDYLRKYIYLRSMKQIGFIVGTGRCGTTILARVLNSHSKICVPHELQIICGIGNGDRLYEKYQSAEAAHYNAEDFINLIRERCPYYFERYFDYISHFKNLGYPQSDLRTLLKALFDHICYANGKEVFLEQTPWYGQKLNVLKELFPEMKVIHMVRDGRDVALSYARTPWWSKEPLKNLEKWEKEINIIHDYGMKNPENYIEIRYEDLVIDPVIKIKRILNLLHLDFEEEMLDSARLIDYSRMFKGNAIENQSNEFKKWIAEKTKVFFAENLYAWKRNKEVDFSSLSKQIRETLKAFNYDVS